MRYLRVVLAGLALAGCAEADDLRPTAPTVFRNASVSGKVVDASGACIPGAVALVVRGQAAGQTVAQETPCVAGDQYEGGFAIRSLAPGVEMTIRVTAPGYSALERTVVPPVGVLEFVLATQ